MAKSPKNSSDPYPDLLERDVDQAVVFNALVALVINPIRLASIEAMLWVGRPLSPTLLVQLLAGIEIDGDLYPGRISYHLQALEKFGVIEKVHRRRVRGAFENYYFFSRR